MADEKTDDQEDSNDLDSVLKALEDFDDETGKDETKKGESEPATDVAALQARIAELEKDQREDKAFREDALRKELDQDIDGIAQRVQGLDDSFADLPLKAVRGWLTQEAAADPRIEKAWQQRHSDPDTFSKMIEALGKRMATERVDLSEDNAKKAKERESVNAYIRSQSGEPPSHPDVPTAEETASMSVSELKALANRLAQKPAA